MGGGFRGPKGKGRRLPKPCWWEALNFTFFFPLSFFFLWGLLIEFWWCFEAPGPSNVHVWSSRAVV